MGDLRYSSIEKNIPIPEGRNSGLTEMLRKLEFGDSIIIPPNVKISSIYPTAKRLGFKVRTKKEYDPTPVRMWNEIMGRVVLETPLIGVRVWRISK